MTYKTIVIDYAPKAKKMAAAVEKEANKMAQNGWELVTPVGHSPYTGECPTGETGRRRRIGN